MEFSFSEAIAADPAVEETKPEWKWPSGPDWFGPQGGIECGVYPCTLTVARTEHVVILLSHVRAYPNGCQLPLRVAARRAGLTREEFDDIGDTIFDYRRHRFHSRLSDGGLRYAVRYSDGRTATTLRPRPFDARLATPAGPLLERHGGGHGGGNSETVEAEEMLWLWPLPPSEPFELIVEGPTFGIPVTIVELDGAAIAAAANSAIQFWPNSMASRG